MEIPVPAMPGNRKGSLRRFPIRRVKGTRPLHFFLPGPGGAAFDGAADRLRCHALSLHGTVAANRQAGTADFLAHPRVFYGAWARVNRTRTCARRRQARAPPDFFRRVFDGCGAGPNGAQMDDAGVGSGCGTHFFDDADGVLANQHGRLSRYLDGFLCRSGRSRRGASGRGVHTPVVDPRQCLRRRGREHQIHRMDSPGSDRSLLVVGDQILLVGSSARPRVATGVFPLLRNFLWTGDPFFPFLSRWMGKVAVNQFALESIQADVHSHAFSTQPLHVLYFLAAITVRGADFGLGTLFWPRCPGFPASAILLQLESAALVGSHCVVGRDAPRQCSHHSDGRFLLPAYPLALALVLYGAAAASREVARFVRFGCAATLALFGLFCLASDTLYAKDFLPVSVGLESKVAFLDRMAPDYQAATFVNSALTQRRAKPSFFRHSYYMRVLYEDGDPGESWMMNPAVLANPQSLLAFLKEQDIGWIVKSPSTPSRWPKYLRNAKRKGCLFRRSKLNLKL